MAVRSDITAHEGYQQFQALVRQLKLELIGPDGTGGWAARLAAQNIDWLEFVRSHQMLITAISNMVATTTIPGIVDYVKSQEQDPAYDVAAEYVALHSALVAIRDWIFTNIPKQQIGGTGPFYLAVSTLNADGSITERSFTPAQTAGLRTLITTNFKNAVM